MKTTRDSVKRLTLATGLAFALAACGGSDDSGSATTGSAATSQYEVAGDHAIGDVNAPITIVEYASVVCGACKSWHLAVFDEFKTKYIDTGKVRFIFREFPTEPAEMARAGFLIANCADEDQFFDNIKFQFKKQSAIFAAANVGKAKDEYTKLAKAAGLSEEEFKTCLANVEENERLDKVEALGMDQGVGGTPTFFMNGKKTSARTLEQFDAAFAEILGEAPAPASEE